MERLDALISVIRRVLVKHGASIDPFSVMELATLLRPALRGEGRGGGSLESAVEFLAGILESTHVPDAGRVAERVVAEILEQCGRVDCS